MTHVHLKSIIFRILLTQRSEKNHNRKLIIFELKLRDVTSLLLRGKLTAVNNTTKGKRVQNRF
jgi:hypothetical protein